MAAIARGADREEAAAEPTRFLAKRRVHDVGAATHSNWTRTSNRGTKRADWLGPSEHRGGHRGSGGCSSRPSPRLPRTELTRPHADVQAKRRWTLTELWTRRRAHSSLQNRADAVSHERPPPSSFREQETGTERPARDVQISTLLRGQRHATLERWSQFAGWPRTTSPETTSSAGSGDLERSSRPSPRSGSHTRRTRTGLFVPTRPSTHRSVDTESLQATATGRGTRGRPLPLQTALRIPPGFAGNPPRPPDTTYRGNLRQLDNQLN